MRFIVISILIAILLITVAIVATDSNTTPQFTEDLYDQAFDGGYQKSLECLLEGTKPDFICQLYDIGPPLLLYFCGLPLIILGAGGFLMWSMAYKDTLDLGETKATSLSDFIKEEW